MKINFQDFQFWNRHASKVLAHPLSPESVRFVNEEVSVIPALSIHRDLAILANEWIPVSPNGDATFERMIHTPDQYLAKAKCIKYEENAYFSNEVESVELNGPAILVGGSGNYYHWLIDYLPRLLVSDFFQDFKDWPILINGGLQSFQKDALDMLCIPERQIIGVADRRKVVAREVLVPTLLSNKTVCHSAVPQMLRESFPSNELGVEKRRIYLCREDATSRRLVNHQEVLALLEDYGFEQYFPSRLSFQEQINICAQAEAIFGVHGAALANLVFCQPNTLVFEVSNPTHRVTSMLVLSKISRLKHYFISAVGWRSASRNPLLEDWIVDIDVMRKELSQAFAQN